MRSGPDYWVVARRVRSSTLQLLQARQVLGVELLRGQDPLEHRRGRAVLAAQLGDHRLVALDRAALRVQVAVDHRGVIHAPPEGLILAGSAWRMSWIPSQLADPL